MTKNELQYVHKEIHAKIHAIILRRQFLRIIDRRRTDVGGGTIVGVLVCWCGWPKFVN